MVEAQARRTARTIQRWFEQRLEQALATHIGRVWVQEAGVAVGARHRLNFVSGATATDDPTEDRVNVTITGALAKLAEVEVTDTSTERVQFLSIPQTYRHLRVVAVARTTTTTGAAIPIRVLVNLAFNGGYDQQAHSHRTDPYNSQHTVDSWSGGYIGRIPDDASFDTTSFGVFTVEFPFYTTAFRKHYLTTFAYAQEGSSGSAGKTVTLTGAGSTWDTDPIHDLSFDTGNVNALEQGSIFTLYGIT